MSDGREADASEAGLPGPVIAVVGPTAAGKSPLGQELAVRFGGEVVSADSMQIYRGMDIGTAKQRPEHRRVPHHMLDVVDPGTPYSAALYQREATTAIDGIIRRGLVPVVVGGTGLYVRAALDEMTFPSGQASTPTRQRYEALLLASGPESLHRTLAEKDPAAAAVIHPNNSRRVVRALEMLDDEGVSYAAVKSSFSRRCHRYHTVQIGLTMDRHELYRRIDVRVDEMVTEGLLAEVGTLLSAGYKDALTATQAIGYKELVPVLEQGEPLEPAVAAIKQATRRYAKRQLTWFRADPRVRWLDVTEMSPDEAADEASALVESDLSRSPART